MFARNYDLKCNVAAAKLGTGPLKLVIINRLVLDDWLKCGYIYIVSSSSPPNPPILSPYYSPKQYLGNMEMNWKVSECRVQIDIKNSFHPTLFQLNNKYCIYSNYVFLIRVNFGNLDNLDDIKWTTYLCNLAKRYRAINIGWLHWLCTCTTTVPRKNCSRKPQMEGSLTSLQVKELRAGIH